VIDFMTARPLKEAVDSISRRTPMGTALNSAELERLPLEIRDAAFFSAQVQNERILAEAQKRITQRVNLERSKLADGKPGVTMDRRRFIDEMRVELGKLGYRPDAKKVGTIQDLSSSGRLGLIWDMNLAQAEGAAGWKTSMSETALRVEPAMEFIRVENRIDRRIWPVVWAANGGKFYPGPSEYPEGRMLALKTDDIWRRINRFGVPWRPFDWGSGMGTRGVGRREALKLGVIKEGDPPQKPENLPLTAGLQASVKGLPEASRERLRSEMGDSIRFDKDAIFYQRDTTEANEHRDKTVPDELRARARSYFERGEEALGEIRSNNDGAEAFFGSPEADEFRQVFLAQLAAVGTGRKQLFHDSFPPDAATALMEMVAAVMPQVETEFDEGHLIAWRPDLQELAPSELLRLSKEEPIAKNGILLGYGLESRQTSAAFDQIYLQGPDGRNWSGFHAAPRTSRIYAAARLRDLVDAIGDGFEAVIVNMPSLTKGGAP
jgi:hypothetical protein